MCSTVPREQRLARASFWSREARLTLAILAKDMYAKSYLDFEMGGVVVLSSSSESEMD